MTSCCYSVPTVHWYWGWEIRSVKRKRHRARAPIIQPHWSVQVGILYSLLMGWWFPHFNHSFTTCTFPLQSLSSIEERFFQPMQSSFKLREVHLPQVCTTGRALSPLFKVLSKHLLVKRYTSCSWEWLLLMYVPTHRAMLNLTVAYVVFARLCIRKSTEYKDVRNLLLNPFESCCIATIIYVKSTAIWFLSMPFLGLFFHSSCHVLILWG